MHPLTSDFHILASIKGPVKHEPVDQWDPDFAWRVQMGLGLHGKKMEAIRPLTSDYHKLASIQDPIKHQPVDQDCAWRVHMGLGFNKKKMEAIWPLTSDYHILASIKGLLLIL